jgi:hypothetical protein
LDGDPHSLAQYFTRFLYDAAIIGFVLGWRSAHSLAQYFTRFLYDARISNVMARSRRDSSSSRFGIVEDL